MEKIIFTRINSEDLDLIKKVCQLRGENISTFVRRAVYQELARLGYLDKERQKALGIGDKEV